MNKRKIGGSVLFLVLASVPAAFADLLVVPDANATVAGNNPNTIAPSSDSMRSQVVFGSGQFSNMVGDTKQPLGPMLIDGFYLRPSPGTGDTILDISSFAVTLSTTQAYPNTTGSDTLPSTTFSDNVGPDSTLVYNGALDVDGSGCSSSGTTPCAFDIFVPFQTSFLYDPASGRLLLDLTISDVLGDSTGSLDQEMFANSSGPGSSTLATINGGGGDTTGSLSLGGPIVEFKYTETPEPATGWLLPAGAGIFWLGRKFRWLKAGH